LMELKNKTEKGKFLKVKVRIQPLPNSMR